MYYIMTYCPQNQILGMFDVVSAPTTFDPLEANVGINNYFRVNDAVRRIMYETYT